MKLKIRKGQIPPGGHHFKQNGTLLKGYSKENIIDKIGKFRLANSLEYGNPKEDYENFICDSFPRTCTPDYSDGAIEDDIKELVDKPKGERTALEELRLWGKITLHRKQKWKALETQEVAEERAEICSACPSRRDLGQLTQCHGCIEEVTRVSTMTREGKKTKVNPGWCSSLLHDNRTAVFLPKEGLERSMERVQDAPEVCWLHAMK